ncbi:MAG: helix-turn-helix domain-containing protein [Clostridia bacterium]|nr:helix-turn-helix domain-containing protein [Clostridia bacterium]
MEFKEKIKIRRQELGLTLDDVAMRVGVRAATVSRWESGEIKNIRRDKIKLLADALQVSPAYLMDWDDSSPSQDQFLEEFRNAPHEVIVIGRAAKKMTPEQRKKLIEMAKLYFDDEELFK